MKQTQSVTSDSEASFIPRPTMSSRGRQSRIGCSTVNISLLSSNWTILCLVIKKNTMDCFPFSKVIMWIIPFMCAVTLWRMLCHSSGFLWTQFDIKWLMCDNKNRRTNTVIATHTMNNPRNVQSTLFRTKNYWGSVVVSHEIDNVGHCPVPVRVSGEGGGWPRGGEIFSHQQIRVWPLQSGNRSHYSLYNCFV